MRRLWLGLLLCACSGSSDNEVDGSVQGYSLSARDALYLVHNGRRLVVISDQDDTCRKLGRQTLTGDVRLLEIYLWDASTNDPGTLAEGTYVVADDGSDSLESQVFFGVNRGCAPENIRWFAAGRGQVILLHSGDNLPGERTQIAFRLNFGDELLAGHADAVYCGLPSTGAIGCIAEGSFAQPPP
jgi:hypothetical protein